MSILILGWKFWLAVCAFCLLVFVFAARGQKFLAARNQAPVEQNSESHPAGSGPRISLFFIGVLTLLLGIGSYLYLGVPGMPDFSQRDQEAFANQSQAEREKALAETDALPIPNLPADIAPLLDQLEAHLKTTPDIEGFELLSKTAFKVEDFTRAAWAQEGLIKLLENKATAAHYTTLAEMQIRNVRGYVSPEARDNLEKAISLEEAPDSANFFLAQYYLQHAQKREAQTLLEALSQSALDPTLRRQAAELLAKLNETAPAESGSSLEPTGNPQVTETQIRAMVGGLQDRLQTQGGSAQEWGKLVRSLRILGENAAADQALETALKTYPTDPDLENLSSIQKAPNENP